MVSRIGVSFVFDNCYFSGIKVAQSIVIMLDMLLQKGKKQSYFAVTLEESCDKIRLLSLFGKRNAGFGKGM